MAYLLFIFPGNEELGQKLLEGDAFSKGEFEIRNFPDGETYIRIKSDVKNKALYILCTLDRPDQKIIGIYFFSQTAYQLGAQNVVLLAPYLSYMRQDKVFHHGEGITAKLFANLISSWVDALVAFDPHLHRIKHLSALYSIPTLTLRAEPLIQAYVKKNVKNPLLIGPDHESQQWVSRVAAEIGCDYVVLNKKRMGDRQVKIEIPDAAKFKKHTPVLIDDIVSSGRTLAETIEHLKSNHLAPPVCIVIHAVFADRAYRDIMEAGAERIVSTNTITHPTNRLDVSPFLLDSIIDNPPLPRTKRKES